MAFNSLMQNYIAILLKVYFLLNLVNLNYATTGRKRPVSGTKEREERLNRDMEKG